MVNPLNMQHSTAGIASSRTVVHVLVDGPKSSSSDPIQNVLEDDLVEELILNPDQHIS